MRQPGNRDTDFFSISGRQTGDTVVHLHGSLDVDTAAPVLKKLSIDLDMSPLLSLTLDLSDVSNLDEYGALVLFEIKHQMGNKGLPFEMINIDERSRRILSLVHFDTHVKCSQPQAKNKPGGMLIRLGEGALTIASNLKFMISFIGSLILSLGHVMAHPRALRINDTIVHMAKTGVDALPIVALISFLLGLIMAFMSSLQLSQFGANIYVASLVAMAMVSELGPIMTAIVVAGRSGSAFAAEIGTMRISEEVDALFTMGFNPTVFLAIPRMLALMVTLPLLTVFSNIFAIAGGLTIGILVLDLTPGSYMTQTLDTLTVFEMVWGMAKSMVFAILIAWVGCLRGFQARGGAAAVGNAATSAVVTSIFLIILFDSVFAVMRSYWG
jgi:phospholipid/cholesterol/gamma-HCH transport system permease protein